MSGESSRGFIPECLVVANVVGLVVVRARENQQHAIPVEVVHLVPDLGMQHDASPRIVELDVCGVRSIVEEKTTAALHGDRDLCERAMRMLAAYLPPGNRVE